MKQINFSWEENVGKNSTLESIISDLQSQISLNLEEEKLSLIEIQSTLTKLRSIALVHNPHVSMH
jgi:hypothetical protein